jgi:1-deoxy-D-xylulose-5-phosphate reductoisomerase
MKKKIAILGSTGSIGTQTLEVIANNKDRFEVTALTANNNADLLIEQAIAFVPQHVVIANESKLNKVIAALSNYDIEVHAGCDAVAEIVKDDNIDMVLTAMVGFAGLTPTINAIKTGKHVALANKETLVVAGDLIMNLAKKHLVHIYPVDSEHSAIFQCLTGEEENPIEKIYLTASGGPFREMDYDKMKHITKAEALHHPNWCMGPKITIDSATLMNKGLESIEAKWLFGLSPDQVDVIVHPQSIVHSLVQFEDGSLKAQMGLPDMRLPIQYALGYPKRLKSAYKRFNFADYPSLTFEKADTKKFRNLALSFIAMRKGGNIPCAMNAANEVAVQAFLEGKIGFLEMSDIIEKTMEMTSFVEYPGLKEYQETDIEARNFTNSLI